MSGKRAVIAIGGNSLATGPGRTSIADQNQAAKETGRHIADLVKDGWEVMVSHGNGPQVGFILRKQELTRHELDPVPLDICVSDTQGSIGFILAQNLMNDFRHAGIHKQVAAVVTQVEVDPNDPDFRDPSKPIGSFMTEEEAMQHKENDGWHVKEDANRGWRRVVPSPQPLRILEQEALRCLLENNFAVIGVGGGGIPVYRDEFGNLKGVEAVIDKDNASSLLARELNADLLLISTAVEKVALRFGQPDEEWLDELTLDQAKGYLEEGNHFAAGSMAPKIRAVVSFLEGGGKEALITNPVNLVRGVAGLTGTRVVA